MNRLAVVGILIFASAMTILASDCANPLGFPEYEQTVEVECKSAKDAKEITLELMPLPDGAKIAFSTRWDDTNNNNFPKAEMLERAGAKGGFYLVGAKSDPSMKCWAKLLKNGHAIGNHTISHKFMNCLSPNSAFREILVNRIMLEELLDHAIISYVSPYGWGNKTIDKGFTERTVKMLIDTGHWVSCDNPLAEGKMPENIWYPSQRFAADDRNPQWSMFSLGLAEQEKIAKSSQYSPRVVLGTHAWCNEEGNRLQEKWIKENCIRDDWVQLNDYEYGAYRYSYINGAVKKVSTKGNKAIFSVKRFDPASLSDEIPLSIRFTGEVKRVICGGKAIEVGKNGTWKLKHDMGRQVVSCIGLADESGVSEKIPGIVTAITYDDKRKKVVVAFENKGRSLVEDVFGVVYLPPSAEIGRITFEVPKIAVGERMIKEFAFVNRSKFASYDPDDALFAASVDFKDGGARKRIWTTKSVAIGSRIKVPRDSAKWSRPASIDQLDDEHLRKLSIDRWAISAHKGTEWDTGSVAGGAWYAASWHAFSFTREDYAIVNGKENKYQAVVLQFKVKPGQKVMARSDAFESRAKAVVFLNGDVLPVGKTEVALPVSVGSNRIVIRREMIRGNYSFPIQLAIFDGDMTRPIECEDIPDGLYAGDTKYGEKTRFWTIRGTGGLTMEVLDCGGKVSRILVPDRDGKKVDVTIGFDHPSGWENTDAFFGAIIGRVGNRIADGKFKLNGREYKLAINDKNHNATLHGGDRGWNDYVWKAEPFALNKDKGIVFSRVSPAGEEGFPGRMEAKVTYTITPDNIWRIDYEATTDAATPVNLTHHVYFDMNGDASILAQELMIDADKYTPVDKNLKPTGKFEEVAGTPFDFREFHKIGERIDNKNNVLQFGSGYDHNWVLNGKGFRKVAELRGTRRAVEVWTDQPGLQFYAGNFIKDDWTMKDGRKMKRRGWIALETQHYPNAPNQANFPSITLRPGDVYRTRTEYRFKSR